MVLLLFVDAPITVLGGGFGGSYAVLNVLSTFAIFSLRKRELVAILSSCGCWCSVTLPIGTMGWSAVYICVAFHGHTHLRFVIR